jgi:transposase
MRKKLDTLKEEFNIKITEVNLAYTSQTCYNCRYVSPTNRKSQKVFVCEFCGKNKI